MWSRSRRTDESYVKAGDVLVQLDKSDLEVALAKAQADLADAEATLESARSDVPAAIGFERQHAERSAFLAR